MTFITPSSSGGTVLSSKVGSQVASPRRTKGITMAQIARTKLEAAFEEPLAKINMATKKSVNAIATTENRQKDCVAYPCLSP